MKGAVHRCAQRAAVLILLPAVLLLAAMPGVARAQGIPQQVRSDDMTTLNAIDVPAAWAKTKGAGVTVAVLDTGANGSVPDLTGQVIAGPDYTVGADPAGFNPPHEHGTYICSIIAGHGSGPGRSEGMVGVAPQARLLSVRVILDDSEPGFAVYNENAKYVDAIANGINYAVGHGASVINMSLGSPTPTAGLRKAIANAVAKGVVIVASAGNSGTAGGGFSAYSYPASFTGVISVAAVGPAGHRASFSERNASVVVSAPGVNVAGAGPDGGYLIGSGTSPAAAFVTGVAALIKSAYPHLAPWQVVQAIVTSTKIRPAGGFAPGVGFGEVDASAAMSEAAKLAAAHGSSGELSAVDHFGTAPGPVVVVPRNVTRIAALGAVSIAALIGFVVCLGRLRSRARRRRRYRPAPLLTSPFEDPYDYSA